MTVIYHRLKNKQTASTDKLFSVNDLCDIISSHFHSSLCTLSWKILPPISITVDMENILWKKQYITKNRTINLPILLSVTVCYFSLVCGNQKVPGIYIEAIRPYSVLAAIGIEQGDQIIKANNISFSKITLSQVGI